MIAWLEVLVGPLLAFYALDASCLSFLDALDTSLEFHDLVELLSAYF